MNQPKLLNKKIIISAAANGIGWSIAQECMLSGAIVYITDKNKESLDKISKHKLYEKQGLELGIKRYNLARNILKNKLIKSNNLSFNKLIYLKSLFIN